MAYVVTENCINCKYGDCVEVCPVDCFHEGPNFLVIDPEECIDCSLCVAECPAEAIFAEDDVPAEQFDFIALNAELCQSWPVIRDKKPSLADADAWLGLKGKRDLLRRGALGGGPHRTGRGSGRWSPHPRRRCRGSRSATSGAAV